MEKVSKYSLVLLTILLVALLMHASISELKLLVAVQSDEELKASKSFQYQYPLFHVLAFLHIPVGLIFLVTGGYQFIPVFRKRYHQTHKTVGRIFLVSSLIVSSTAITMGIFYPYGNYLESLTSAVFGTYLLAGTYWAYLHARKRNFVQHQRWVIRVYFISLSVASIRIIAAMGIIMTGKSLQEVLGVSFVMAFLLHFLAVEVWIKYQGRVLRTPLG
ncbi:DUF2306 domain-containing protein [Litoribacter alkaliphilus]|uniref:DUF2306 domain-containing protein n=1 Tax=Litoribacter ruber TaxID=702568 RepID=A0AAP2CGS0_9BACT|nr:DUF2306 domain-containing protein [Litoribacter alkaliphilus]MBS9523817.1 DUF2306 domain-containing protein [Litoribacter alkaliphilus]